MCDGWVGDLEAIGAPSMLRLIRSAAALARMWSTLDLSCERPRECVNKDERKKKRGEKEKNEERKKRERKKPIFRAKIRSQKMTESPSKHSMK